MARPSTREEFKQYCLRKLGKGAITINVTDEQVEDRIDESLQYFRDYHFDGAEKVYYKHQITQQDKDNHYITIPENIIGAISIFPIGDPAVRSDDLFNIRYQIALNDLYTLTSVSMVPYYMTMQHLSLIQEMLVGKQPIRYSRHRNRVDVDMDWDNINPGEYLLIEAYEVIDPDAFPDVWNDRWLQNYCTAKIKYQWAGANLSKFNQMAMPNGMQFNAERLADEARQEIEKMEEEMITKYSMPPLDMIG